MLEPTVRRDYGAIHGSEGETTPTRPEWILLLRAALDRERTALAVAVTAVVVAALIIVVIPVMAGQMG